MFVTATPPLQKNSLIWEGEYGIINPPLRKISVPLLGPVISDVITTLAV